MALHPYSNETHTRWDKGEFQAMVKSPRSSKPVAFCDGTIEDEEAIRAQALKEGTGVEIEKKALKSGREVWTVKPRVS